MTVSEISKNNHKHDIFTERQIQLALLQADEDFLRRDFFEVTKKVNYSNSKRKGRRKEEDDNNYELTGWVPDRNASLKKKEKDITDSGKSTNREYISWRDSKVRSLERHNYIFRHYKDVKKYIEQYRKECTCCKNSGIPSTKDTFDLKKLRGEKGSPILNHKNSSQKPETNSKNTNPKPHTFSYTTRNVSNPFNGYTDFFSGNTSTFMANMEKNVQKILKSDSEKCNGDGDVYNRKASFEDSSHLYVRSNGTEIKTSANSNRQSPRVRDRTPSRTKLTPPLKIRTLDALHTDCNHQDSQDSSKSNNTPSPSPSSEPIRSLPRLNISPFLPNDPETKTNLHRRCSSESDTKSKRILQETEHSVGLSPIPLGDLTSKSSSSSSENHQQDCDGQTPNPNKTPCTLPIIGKSQPLHHSQKKSKHREKRPARRSQNTEFDSESEDKEIANWREKLDALRKVRKPHLKPKERSRRFNVYREDNLVGRFEIAGESHCIAQRQKIQELLENSRVKLKTICSQMDRKSSQPPDFDELINAVRGCQIQHVSNDGRTDRKSKPMKLTT